jgi:acyl-coenzyme A synthetase/AMP-(fatty) acid ligase
MEYFWNDLAQHDGIALQLDSGPEISYSELQKLADEFSKLLPEKKQLVFLQVTNTFESVISYLACLRSGHPVLLLDSQLDDELFQNLVATYQPNWIIREADINNFSDFEHSFHNDLAVLLSTSGTTGSPKLVRLTKRNINANARSIAKYLNLDNKQVTITTLPFHYSYGLSVINSHLVVKAKVVLTNYSVMTREFWRNIEDYQVTSFAGVPYVFQMLRRMRYDRFNSSSIQYLTQAGGKLDDETVSYFNGVTNARGQKFIVMYGQTEATARISYLPPEMLENKFGSIGIPIPDGDLFLETPSGQLTKQPGVEGQLVYEGPNVMMGYAEHIIDLASGDVCGGRLKTGDIGYCDEDGYFYITGREKRFIKVFGYRISLDAVDNYLQSQNYNSATLGSDDKLEVFITNVQDQDLDSIKKELAHKFRLNLNLISVSLIDKIPRTTSGTIDFPSLKSKES